MTIANLDATSMPASASESLAKRTGAVRSTPVPQIGSSAAARQPSDNQSTAESPRETLTENVRKLNGALGKFGVEFHLSEIDNCMVTRVIDRESGELIRQIPSDEMLRMAQNMEQLRGLLLSQQA